jgi:ABC-2 type transport system ATP-binding protein
MAHPTEATSEHSTAPLRVCIAVRGHVSSEWLTWLDKAVVEPAGDTTVIWVDIVDQVALRGLLSRLWDLNITVISVNPAWPEAPTKEEEEMTEQPAVMIRGMTKSYGKVRALRGLDLEVPRGEIFGFLGPNGAGKTTTIRCLLDTIRPDGGTARVLGLDPQRDAVAVHARTGYLPGELHLDDNMTGEAQLRYFNALRGLCASWALVEQLAGQLDLDLRRPIKNLSRGNKQKVGIIQAVMHHPELLILDEPTSGLDPLVQRTVLRLIKEARDEGATVFFSSHIMSEIEAVADRVGIIREGVLVEVAAPASLQARALQRVMIRLSEPVSPRALIAVDGVRLISQDDETTATLEVLGEMAPFLRALAPYPVRHLETVRPSLEDAFLAYYGHQQH